LGHLLYHTFLQEIYFHSVLKARKFIYTCSSYITCRAPFSWCARQGTFIIKQKLSWLYFHAYCALIYPSLWTALIWSNAYSFEVTFFLNLWNFTQMIIWSNNFSTFKLISVFLYLKTTRMKLNAHENISLSREKSVFYHQIVFYVYINRLENIRWKTIKNKSQRKIFNFFR
jgi:hypothetical protein